MSAPVTIDFAGDASPLVREIERIKNEIKGLDSSSAQFSAEYRRLMGEATLASRQFKASVGEIPDGVGKASDSVAAMVGTLGKLYIAFQTVQAAISGFTALQDMVDDLGDVASGLGMSVEQLQGWTTAAESAGIKGAKLTMGFERLNEATQGGNKELADLGINLEGLTVPEAIEKIAKNMSEAKTQGEKLNIAMKAFGAKGAANWVGLLEDGGAAALELVKAFEQTVGVSKDAQRAADLFTTQLSIFSNILKNSVADALSGITTRLGAMIAAFNTAKISGQGFFSSIGSALNLLTSGSAGLGAEGVLKSATEQYTAAKAKLDESTRKAIASGSSSDMQSVKDQTKNLNLLSKEVDVAKTQVNLLNKSTDEAGKQGTKSFKSISDSASKTGASIKKMVDPIKEYLDQVVGRQQDIDNFDMKVRALSDAFAAGTITSNTFINEMKSLTDAWNAYKAATDQVDPLEKFKKSAIDSQAEMDSAASKLAVLKDLLSSGTISQNVFDQAASSLSSGLPKIEQWTLELQRLRDTTKEAGEKFNYFKEMASQGLVSQEEFQKLTDSTGNVTDQLTEMQVAFGNIISQGVSGLVDSFFQMDQSFSQAVSNMLKEVGKLIAKMLVLKALEMGMSALGLGAKSGGAQAPSLFSPMASFNSRTASIQEASAPTLLSSFKSPTVAVPRNTLGSDLALITSAMSKATSQKTPQVQNDVKVNVYNQNQDNQVEVKKNKKQNGMSEIDIYIKQKVTSMMNDGSMDKTFRTRYGMSPNPI